VPDAAVVVWEEPGEHWTLRADDLALLAALPAGGRLGLAAQLAHWRQNGRFPDDEADLAPAVVGHLATQVGVRADVLEGYEWTGRTGCRHRRLVLDHLAVAAFDDAAEAKFRSWLSDELLPREPAPPVFEGEVSGWFARERISRPGSYRLDRILRSATCQDCHCYSTSWVSGNILLSRFRKQVCGMV
jgi:hypothetical protein